MKKLILICISIGLTMIGNLSYSQSKLLIAMDDISNDTWSTIASNGVMQLKIIYGVDIYPDNPLKVNLKTLESAITKAFPNRNQSGYGMLDWEGKGYHILAQSKSTTVAFKNVMNEFISALEFAQKMRPNVKWGFFEIPIRQRRFASQEVMKSAHIRIAPLLKQCDVFYPSMYGYTPNDIGSLSDVSYSLNLGKKYNKEVYPMVWHRYQGDKSKSKKYWFELIPKNIFSNRIIEIKNTKYNGRSISGIVWWGKDTYFYEKNNKVVKNEARSISQFRMKYDSMVKDYVNEILKK